MGLSTSAIRRLETLAEVVDIYGSGDRFVGQFAQITSEEQTLFSTSWVVAEVLNGGFHQFFWNSTGVLAPEAKYGFEALGLATCARLLETAMDFFGPSYPRDREARIAMLEQFEEANGEDTDPFEGLDGSFYDQIENEHGGYWHVMGLAANAT